VNNGHSETFEKTIENPEHVEHAEHVEKRILACTDFPFWPTWVRRGRSPVLPASVGTEAVRTVYPGWLTDRLGWMARPRGTSTPGTPPWLFINNLKKHCYLALLLTLLSNLSRPRMTFTYGRFTSQRARRARKPSWWATNLLYWRSRAVLF